MLVEIWSDVVCPWCAIGTARLDRALAAWEHADEVTVRFRSFELDPRREGTVEGDYAAMLSRKYGTSQREARSMIERMERVGAEEGVEFRFDIARPGSTFDAHRLLHLAADRGIQVQVKRRFLDGYHREGVAIAEHDELGELAVAAGLDRDEVATVLQGDAYADAVRADQQRAYEHGIGGVPYFVFGGAAALSGAQPVSHLRTALTEARAASAGVTPPG